MNSRKQLIDTNAIGEYNTHPFVDNGFWQPTSDFGMLNESTFLHHSDATDIAFHFDAFGNFVADNQKPLENLVQLESPQERTISSNSVQPGIRESTSDTFDMSKQRHKINVSKEESTAKKKYKYSNADRLYGYANARIPLKDREEWESMLTNGNPIAIDLQENFRAEANYRGKKSRLLQKLQKYPNNEYTLKRLSNVGCGSEEHQRQELAETKRRQIDEKKRRSIDRIVLLLCDDIRQFNEVGDIREAVDTSVRKFKEEERILTDFTDANEEADYILNLVKTLRRDFRDCPLYPGLVPVVDRLNEWLHSTRHHNLQVVLPRGYPKSALDRVDATTRQALRSR